MSERIASAAIMLGGVICSVPAPGRHHNIIRGMVDLLGVRPPIGGDQGFLTSTGRFVNRFEALDIARHAGQILRETAPAHGLFSEDVW